jgi:hypothetical protein
VLLFGFGESMYVCFTDVFLMGLDCQDNEREEFVMVILTSKTVWKFKAAIHRILNGK